MLEKDKVIFFDTSKLKKTEDIERRCNVNYIDNELKKEFKDEKLTIKSVTINKLGIYKNKKDGFIMSLAVSHKLENLPEYVEIRVDHEANDSIEHIIYWIPLAWNDRFMGTGGGGTGTGGDQYITRPTNTSRGQNLGYAIINGFASGTTDGGLAKNNWGINKKTNEINYNLIENWHGRSTHFMTVLGKKLCTILHLRDVKYSYFHGGSGGGRQAMVCAQDYPSDYNGVWASCPAINWTKFLIAGYWPVAVMNSYNHYLNTEKLEFFKRKAQEKVGGEEKYYKECNIKIPFNALDYVGEQLNKKEVISELDAKVMNDIFNGPFRASNHEKLCGFFRPGDVFWIKILPLACIYYPPFSKKPKAFFLCDHYASWVIKDTKKDLNKMKIEDFEKLYDLSIKTYPRYGADNPDLNEFNNLNHKLIIDHGMDDPLIPVEGSINYRESVINKTGNKEIVNNFLKLYITPGDGHGNCTYHGAGISESTGMKALIAWVENKIEPNELETIKVDKNGELVYKSTVKAEL